MDNQHIIANTIVNANNAFISSLDHLPCDVVRSLWLIQSLNLKNDHIKTQLDALTREKTASLDKVRLLLAKLSRNSRECVVEARRMRELLRQHIKTVENDMAVLNNVEAFKKNNVDRKARWQEWKQYKRAYIAKQGEKVPELEPEGEEEEEAAVDGNTEVYCFCRKPDFGKMVECDNETCEFKWFHYRCVGLLKDPLPHEKWFCSLKCRDAYYRRVRL